MNKIEILNKLENLKREKKLLPSFTNTFIFESYKKKRPLEPKYLNSENMSLSTILRLNIFFGIIFTIPVLFIQLVYFENYNFIFTVISFFVIVLILSIKLYMDDSENCRKNKELNEQSKEKYELKLSQYELLFSVYEKKYKAGKAIEMKYIQLEDEIKYYETLILEQTRFKIQIDKTKIKMPNNDSIIDKVINSYRAEFAEIDKRSDLSEDEKVLQIIKIYSSICATIAIQPIPFADIFILTPVQILMGKKIAAIRGYEISNTKLNEILKEIAGILGLGILAQQLAIGAYKTFIPFLGGFTTIPMVFGLTFGIGKVMDYYIVIKLVGKTPDKEKIKNIFKIAKEKGKQEGQEKANDIKNKTL